MNFRIENLSIVYHFMNVFNLLKYNFKIIDVIGIDKKPDKYKFPVFITSFFVPSFKVIYGGFNSVKTNNKRYHKMKNKVRIIITTNIILTNFI